ncbi:MAG TPA: YjbE family putative metal transport protein [Caulobacteraceae bacterium]|nr:YjbE family putative metal transport protein [Caulobacteraceae bacterium]
MHWAGLLSAFAQVILIDLTLAGDNAVAIGMAASGLPREQRRRAIAMGLGGAVVLLCGLAFFAIQLLRAGGGGLVMAGGIVLLLIGRQMWNDLQAARRGDQGSEADGKRPRKTLLAALAQIFIADISTSVDNVLAVAGAVRDQPAWVLFAGLGISVIMTGFAAMGVARLLHRLPWIGYVGFAIVIFVAGHMIWDGAEQLGWLKL